MDTGRKWRSWLKWSKFDVYQLSQRHTPHIVPRVTQTTHRQLPYTFQTPYRHHKIWHILTNSSQLGQKAAAINFNSIQFSYVVAMLLNIFSEQHLINLLYWLYFLTIMWFRIYWKTIVCVYVSSALWFFQSYNDTTKKVSMFRDTFGISKQFCTECGCVNSFFQLWCHINIVIYNLPNQIITSVMGDRKWASQPIYIPDWSSCLGWVEMC